MRNDPVSRVPPRMNGHLVGADYCWSLHCDGMSRVEDSTDLSTSHLENILGRFSSSVGNRKILVLCLHEDHLQVGDRGEKVVFHAWLTNDHGDTKVLDNSDLSKMDMDRTLVHFT